MNNIIPTLQSIKQNRFVSVGSYFAIMGIPNVGKSSIIKCIQKSSLEFQKSSFHIDNLHVEKSPHVGAIPGVTKQVASTKVRSNPDMYMIDTPGIFLPDVKDSEVGLKMALCGMC
jgi:ribosome biogenesis GTPase A